MSRSTGALAAGLVATPCGVVAALAVSVLSHPHGLLAGAGLTCYLVFLLWPWLCLPAGILGGAIAAGSVAGSNLPMIVLIHGGILLAGALALATRWLVAPTRHHPRQRTAADPFMLVLFALIVLGAGYGLARNHEPYLVMVAVYQVAVIPVYFFLTTASLPTRNAVRSASVTFVGALVVLPLGQPHNDAGLFVALALTPLLACVGSLSGWRRIAALAVCGVLAAGVMLTRYRTLWVATGVAMLILVARGSNRVRATTGIALAAGVLVVLGGAALDAGIDGQWAAITAGLTESPGYRRAEAIVGLQVLSEQPFLGAGLGQTSRDLYVEGLGLTDVGPTYHAFWILVLANLGLVGLVAVLAPLLMAARAGLATSSGPALGFAALLCGFLVSGTFAGPTDGHWELGLLAALTMLARNPFQEGNEPCLRPSLMRLRSW
jgi:O-Antigen ligase